MQRTAYLPGLPEWAAVNGAVVFVAARVPGDGPGAVIKPPPSDKIGIRSVGYARQK